MTFITVSENYLEVTGIQILRGRGIRREDDVRSPDVVVVNEAFARTVFPGQDPINRRIGYGARSDPHYWRTIVGLVADREQLGESPRPTAYAPFRQTLEPWNFVLSGEDVAARRGRRRRFKRPCSPLIPINLLRGSGRLKPICATIATQRFTTIIAGTFAGLALILAVVGTFGVMTYVVGGRVRELGVRMALGATPGRIVALIVGQAAPGRPERRSFRCRRCTRNGTIDSDIAVMKSGRRTRRHCRRLCSF